MGQTQHFHLGDWGLCPQILFISFSNYFQFSDTVWLGLGNKTTWLGLGTKPFWAERFLAESPEGKLLMLDPPTSWYSPLGRMLYPLHI